MHTLDKLKINFFSSDGYTYEFSQFMQRAGHDCIYYTDYINHPMLSIGWFAETMTDFEAARVRRLDLTHTSPLSFDVKTKDILEKASDCDVIHTMGLYAYWAVLTGRPFVYQMFGGDITRWPFLDSTAENRARSAIIREILNKATIIWGGYHQKDSFKALCDLGVDPNKIRPMHLPINASHFAPMDESETIAIRNKYDGMGKFVVLLASQLKMNPNAALNYTKGTDIFIRAMAEFIMMVGAERVMFWIVDKGPEREDAHAMVRELKIERNVRWIPPRNRSLLPQLLNSSDIVLDQLWPECGTHGSLALEAMACAKPVFLHVDAEFRQNIAKEPILPNVQVNNEKDVLESLLELYQDSEKRGSIGRASRQCILEEYDVPVAVRKLEAIYREAIQIHNKRFSKK
jgi:glycosyltransferase involved in cell wall biosynthesis